MYVKHFSHVKYCTKKDGNLTKVSTVVTECGSLDGFNFQRVRFQEQEGIHLDWCWLADPRAACSRY